MDQARVEVHPSAGCRIGSVTVGGLELLAHVRDDPTYWGCFPMAPWAGRLAFGRLRAGGRTYQLPLTFPPHAIHGTVLTEKWETIGRGDYVIPLREPWPFGGHVRQTVRLQPGSLTLRLEVHAGSSAMPASCGWHPWFRRNLDSGQVAELAFSAGWMAAKDANGIPTGERLPVGPGPWDDCFGDLTADPVITWPGALRLTVESTCHYYVIFDELPPAICVEPQTALPNALNQQPPIVEPHSPLVAEMTLRWELLK